MTETEFDWVVSNHAMWGVEGSSKSICVRRFSPSALSLFRFHLSPFPPETPDTQAMKWWEVILACIFKQKWNPVSENHNPNVIRTIFSLSVFKELEIRIIWCSASFDRQLHHHFTRWRRYHFGIRPSFTSLLLLGGDIELNPGPAQKQQRIDKMHITQC